MTYLVSFVSAERLDDVTLIALYRSGYNTLEKIAAAKDEELLGLSGVGPVRLRQIRKICEELIES